MTTALVLVDIQNDFLPGGALAVARGDEVVPVANRLMARFPLVVATQDWHPADHASFASQHAGTRVGEVIDLHGLTQVLWPDHCVQGTRGAELAPGLERGRVRHIVQKGTDREIDSYSGFFDNGRRKGTGMDELLRFLKVTDLVVVGLATDYCVRATVLDARSLGYGVTVVREGVRGVDLAAGDSARALREMESAGAKVVSADEIERTAGMSR